MPDKLSIIQDELGRTGNNIPATADDGSDEWTVCSPAYDTAVAETLEGHSWNFDTQIIALNRVGDSPDDMYDDAYAKPDNSLHVIWVRVDQGPIDYKIINNQICLTANGGAITAKYVLDQGASNWPAMFTKIIRCLVRSAIFGGLHEDPQRADVEENKARMALMEARTRVDQESPKRAGFNSRAIAARRGRRPHINSPRGWSGTDVQN